MAQATSGRRPLQRPIQNVNIHHSAHSDLYTHERPVAAELAPAGTDARRAGAKLEQLDLASVRVCAFLYTAERLGVVRLAIGAAVDDAVFTTTG